MTDKAGEAEQQGGAQMDIRLHPLVVMSIADHSTRDRMQFKKTRAIGGLFGQQKGREVKVFETLEISAQIDAKSITIDAEAFEGDMKMFKEVYPNYELLGWYSTTAKIDVNTDPAFHALIQKYNERPLFLLMDPNPSEDARELPIYIYEEDVHVVGDKTTRDFVKTPFKIDSDEAERVTAVHCAKVVTDDNKDQSTVAPHYATISKAITMLRDRIKVLHQFLKDVASNKVKADQKVLREIKGLCNRLPTMDTPDFKQEFLLEYNDALLIAYLTVITKGEAQIGEVMEKFNTTFARQGRGAMGGMGYGPMSAMSMGFGPMGMGPMGFA
jgi:COP9 signalosome complex subunit 6